jgi:F-type H+-transporting ATPase subunit epsilon
MNLKIILPFEIFREISDVSRIMAESRDGSFGLLPNRLDCAASLPPGVLTYETEAGGEVFVAVDEGILVKTGPDVRVSVRRALLGSDLGELRAAVERDFLAVSAHESNTRAAVARMESDLIRRMAGFHHG